jgi:LPXTG-motif cell wall-anchored protein
MWWLMDPLNGGDTSNNPRIDLLHGAGDNQQVSGGQRGGLPMPGIVAASAPPAATSVAAASSEPVEPSLMGVTSKKAEAAPPPPPPPEPEVLPEPRPAPAPASAPVGHSRWPIIIGVLVAVLLLVGAGVAWWWLTMRQEATAPPAPSIEVEAVAPVDLQQVSASGDTVVKGKPTRQTKLTFRWTVPTKATTGVLTPELELRPSSQPFTGEATAVGEDLSAAGHDMEFSIDSEGLAEGSYHWQARVKKGTQPSEWVVYGSDPATVAFTVDTTAPAAPTIETIAGKKAAAGATATIDSNRPTITGKTDPNSVIKLSVAPENLSFNASSDASGAWSLQPDRDIPNGQHQLSVTVVDEAGNASPSAALALAVNPATPVAATPSPATTPTPNTTPTPAPVTATTPQPATVSKTLAATGDNPLTISLLSALVLLVTTTGWLWLRRRHAHL